MNELANRLGNVEAQLASLQQIVQGASMPSEGSVQVMVQRAVDAALKAAGPAKLSDADRASIARDTAGLARAHADAAVASLAAQVQPNIVAGIGPIIDALAATERSMAAEISATAGRSAVAAEQARNVTTAHVRAVAGDLLAEIETFVQGSPA